MNEKRTFSGVKRVAFWLMTIGGLSVSSAHADSVLADSVSIEKLLKRLEAQDARIEQLENAASSINNSETEATSSNVETGYQKGFYIRSKDGASLPFKVKINGRLQARWQGFDRDNSETQSRNEFEVERARLTFSGYFKDPKLNYYINLDGDTDDNHRVVFHDFWFGYQFLQEFGLYAGKVMVPGSRDWRNGSTYTHLVDRSLATTFFRPDRSVGVWAKGKLEAPKIAYEAMVANGLNTTDLKTGGVDDQLAYSANVYWEPLADYGKGYADLKGSQKLAIRVGTSASYAEFGGSNAEDGDEAEQRFVRLSNGTRITEEGALGDGSQVENFDLTLLATDFAAKYRGFSVNSEAFFRWISDVNGTGDFTHTNFYDFGFYVDAGLMVIPTTVELVGRYSWIDGDFGNNDEYAAGANWYVDGTHKNKLTFDATFLDDAIASSSSPNFQIGDSGVMYRLQWQVAF